MRRTAALRSSGEGVPRTPAAKIIDLPAVQPPSITKWVPVQSWPRHSPDKGPPSNFIRHANAPEGVDVVDARMHFRPGIAFGQRRANDPRTNRVTRM